jgi:ankyrin repeat protein
LDVNLKNEDGDTARSLASIAGRKDIVDKLLKHVKTNVDQESKKFKRAADLAKDNGPEEIVNCLTEHVQSCSNCAEQETQEFDTEPTIYCLKLEGYNIYTFFRCRTHYVAILYLK